MLDILLIDDDPELLEITYEELKLHYKNINIVKAFSGTEGIDLLTRGQVLISLSLITICPTEQALIY